MKNYVMKIYSNSVAGIPLDISVFSVPDPPYCAKCLYYPWFKAVAGEPLKSQRCQVL